MKERCWTSGDYYDECRCRFCEAERNDPPQPASYESAPLPIYYEDGHPTAGWKEWDYDPITGEYVWE